MRKVKMKEDHEGARAGDVVAFESDAEAQALVDAGKAEPAPVDAVNSSAPAQ